MERMSASRLEQWIPNRDRLIFSPERTGRTVLFRYRLSGALRPTAVGKGGGWLGKGSANRTAIRLRTEMVGRSVLAEPLNRLSAHRDGFALPSE